MFETSPGNLDELGLPPKTDWRDFFSKFRSRGVGGALNKSLGRWTAAAAVAGALAAAPEAQAQWNNIEFVGHGPVGVQGTNLAIEFPNLRIGESYLCVGRNFLSEGGYQWWQPLSGTGFPHSGWYYNGPDYIWLDYIGFVADKTNGTWETPLDKTNVANFVQCIDFNVYASSGTEVQIDNYQDTPTVNGTITLQSSMFSIFQPVYINVYIDGEEYYGQVYGNFYNTQAVGDGFSGNFTVNTACLDDGPHDIMVTVGFATPSQFPDHPDQIYETSDWVDVIVSNNPVLDITGFQQIGTNFNVSLKGMVPSGGYYDPTYGYAYLGDAYALVQFSLLPQMFNQLIPIPVTEEGVPNQFFFYPTNAAETVVMPCQATSTGYFKAVDASFYNTLSPTYLDVQDNTVVSNTIPVTPSLTSIYPAQKFELKVDGREIGTITNGQGIPNFTLNTTLSPNGPHVLEADCYTLQPEVDPYLGDGLVPVFTNVILTNLMFSNDFAFNQFPFAGVTAGDYIPLAFDTLQPNATITVSVYSDQAQSNLVWQASGTNATAGTWSTNWNLADLNGNPVPLPGVDELVTYYFNVSVSWPQPGGQTDLSKARSHLGTIKAGLPRPLDNSGTYRRAYNYAVNMSSHPYAGLSSAVVNNYDGLYETVDGMNEQMTYLANNGVIYPVSGSTIEHPDDPVYYGGNRGMLNIASPFAIVNNSDATVVWGIWTNKWPAYEAPNDFWDCGHGSLDGFGTGTGNSATVSFDGADISFKLGNNWAIGYTNDIYNIGAFTHRKWFVEINACYAGGGTLNYDFGSPTDLLLWGMSPTTYMSWVPALYPGLGTAFWADNDQVTFMINWRQNWICYGEDTGIDVSTAILQTLSSMETWSTDFVPWYGTQVVALGGADEQEWYLDVPNNGN